MESETPKSYTGIQTGELDTQNILELSNTRTEIDLFIDDLNGIYKINDLKGQRIIRYKQPLFTSEFTQEVMGDIFRQINRISVRTTHTDESIRRYNETIALSLGEHLAINGFRNLVSPKVWALWLESDDLRKKHGIVWAYNDPFKTDYLNLIKEYFNIGAESFGQATLMKSFWHSLLYLLHSGRNKSLDAISLKHEREIIRESYTSTDSEAVRKKEGKFLSFLNRMGGR